jgi:hypothetical protein
LHYFISTVNNFQQCSAPAQIVPVVAPQEEEVIEATEAFVDPNQITIFDVIAEEEAKEAERTEITYTDPAGNTFEAIDFHNAVVNNYTEDLEDAPTYVPDENEEYTKRENASYMKGSDFDIDKDEANFDDLIFNISDEQEDEDSSDFF